MPGKIDALAIFLILLPGFTCAYVTQYLAVRREQTEFDKVTEALLFSFVLYLASLPLFHYKLPIAWFPDPNGAFHIQLEYGHLIFLFAASVLFGVVFAANLNNDWILTLLRRFKITERTSRVAVWHDVFQGTGGWVQVNMKDGKKALGRVRYYSDDSEDRSLFLESASWIDDEGKEVLIDGPGLFLTKDSQIDAVMFLAPPPSASQEKTDSV